VNSETAKVIPFPARRDEAGDVWEPWLTEKVVARHFGVSERTVRRWRLTEGMPSRLFRGSRRFRLSQIEAWDRERSAS
jgi:hypothetical protein